MAKIKSVKYLGEKQTYDLEVDHDDHQFYLSVGALTSNSHATAYCITSYQCAYMLTYYPDEWIASYVDYCTNEKGKPVGQEDPKSVALGEARTLGYGIGKPDINISKKEFVVEDNKLIPSFSALKHVGSAVLQEVKQFRPYESLEDLLWYPNGTWKHSKLNKRAFSTLIKLEAFDSMGLVGEDKTFKSYRQMHYVLVENNDKLKRACSRKKNRNYQEVLNQLIEEAQELEDWSIDEKIKNSEELAGYIQMDLVIPPKIKDYFEKLGYKSVDQWKYDNQKLWAVIKQSQVATTRHGKKYLKAKVFGESGAEQTCFFWGFKPDKDKKPDPNTLIMSKFKKSDFGLSTFFGAVEIIHRS